MAKHYSSKETQMYNKGKDYYGAGHGNFANMPTSEVMREYPTPYRSLDNDGYADTIREIDSVEKDSNRQVDSQRSTSMY